MGQIIGAVIGGLFGQQRDRDEEMANRRNMKMAAIETAYSPFTGGIGGSVQQVRYAPGGDGTLLGAVAGSKIGGELDANKKKPNTDPGVTGGVAATPTDNPGGATSGSSYNTLEYGPVQNYDYTQGGPLDSGPVQNYDASLYGQ